MLCHWSGYDRFVFVLLDFGTADVLAFFCSLVLNWGPFICPYSIQWMCRLLTPRREQGSYNNPAFKKEALHLIATECNVGETDADDEFTRITGRK